MIRSAQYVDVDQILEFVELNIIVFHKQKMEMLRMSHFFLSQGISLKIPCDHKNMLWMQPSLVWMCNGTAAMQGFFTLR